MIDLSWSLTWRQLQIIYLKDENMAIDLSPPYINPLKTAVSGNL